MNTDTIIILPAYNEERSISYVISLIKKLYPGMALVVIDDGSTDKTADLAAELGAIVLSHPFNMGYGASLQTGYKYALLNGYDYLVQMDADGQHDSKGIGVLLQHLKSGNYDIVLGSRFFNSRAYESSIYRIIGVKFFRFMLFLFSGRNISDPTTGFQAMNKKVLKLFAQDLFPCDYPDADIIILLSKMHFKIIEIPVCMFPNPEGKSMHKGFHNALYYIFKMLLSMLVTKLRKYQIPQEE